MKKTHIVILLIFSCVISAFGLNPKREFRGAWLHTVFQDQYKRQNEQQNKAYLCAQLDSLQAAGCNAVIFQVRPQADAFYPSELEPWSRFISDNGRNPGWDPLQFMIDQTHARGMELHAWLNPYRVTSNSKQVLPKSHIYHKHPEWFVKYDGKLYFDPGMPGSIDFITKVVKDIVGRYDIDGIHFDDYFYPYPVKGKEFPDAKSYARYGKGKNRNDWRRENVDKLIETLHKEIKAAKPWVIFGVSPFGIWRNKSSDSRGSETNGLQNYDALYADVLLWVEKGWVDYLMPQLYWDLEHKAASYLTLVDWWNRNAGGRHLYIGQDVDRTMKFADIGYSTEKSQLRHKINLTRNADNIQGNCWWPGYLITKNTAGVADSLKIDFQATISLVPEYPWISSKRPAKVKGLKKTGDKLIWNKPQIHSKADDVVKFVVYRFEPGEEIDLENTEAIETVTPNNEFITEYPGVYVVTALSRVNCESEPTSPIFINDF